MDVAAASIGMHQAQLQNDVTLSVMKISMNDAENTSTQITEMMDNMSLDPNLGTNIDTTV
ncbi:YjfB family protein [Clostridium sp. BJN0001]|uniref:YjfB family protein n=1 Tax=Clostridium sp. BJN0001 TaxID=2930219 RepID=UPI001FCF8296|nr:YjfB family protein [Clostridium sp. BJN0001]